MNSITNFFSSAFLPSSLNATILSLVPKFSGASQITQFRPIYCLNTLYKVISRILVKRLKLCLPYLILPIKVDIAKAFDTLLWEFMFATLDALQIPDQFVAWLKACILLICYSNELSLPSS